GFGGLCERVFRDGAQIAGGHNVGQRLGRFALVLGVLIDGGAHVVQVLFQDGLMRVQNVDLVHRHQDAEQDGDHRADDDQLNQGKAALLPPEFHRPIHTLTSPYISYHSRLCPSTWYKHQTRSARPRNPIADRPAWSAAPSRYCRSWDPWERGAKSAASSRPRSPPRSPACPGPADSP